MKKILLTAFLGLLLLPLMAFAQVIPEQIEVGKILLDLVTNFKTLGPLAIGMSFVLLAVALLKSDIVSGLFKGLSQNSKRVMILILGQAYGVLYLVVNGAEWMSAIMLGFVSSGGAVAIFEALFKKKK